MFTRKSKGRRGSGDPFTYIQEGTVLHGDIEATGRVRIHGVVHGSATVAGVLEVAAEGVIRGERIEAEQVLILGVVEAAVTATGKVEIWRGGRLDGDVKAASLDIEEGASFTGRSEMRPPGAQAALPDGNARADVASVDNAVEQDEEVARPRLAEAVADQVVDGDEAAGKRTVGRPSGATAGPTEA